MAPATLPEALEELEQHGDDGKVLAGGQSLVPLLNMRLAQPEVLIDINRLPNMSSIRVDEREGREGLRIGALTRQRSIENEPGLGGRLPLLAQAIPWVGHQQIRNRGTAGGSIAHADPAAELPLVFRALDGLATVASRGNTRAIAAADFFVYSMTPALAPDELLLDVWLPLPPPRTGQAFLEVARRHGDFALVAVAVSITLDDQSKCVECRIAVGGAAPVPMRASQAESLMRSGQASAELFREASVVAADEMDPTGDIHADAEYRREVVAALVRRALETAFAGMPAE